MKYYGIAMMSVTELVVTVVAFLLLGRWLDQKWAAGSTFTLSLTIIGSILGFIRMAMRLKKLMNDDSK